MTEFSDLVYKVVSNIPPGETKTYSEVATLAKRPGACRAVGNILNKNRDFEKVPYHRVIRSDGTTGGYVLGAEKKKQLLKNEKIAALNSK